MILIYILDDRREELELISRELKKDGASDYHFYTNRELFMKDFINNNVDMTILDFKLEEAVTGLDVLKSISQINVFCKHIIISGRSDVDTVVQCFRNGASDFVDKNKKNYLEELSECIKRLLPAIEKRIYYQNKWLINDTK